MDKIRDEIISSILEAWKWISYTVMGFLARLAFDVMRGKRITIIKTLASFIMAVFVGNITYTICMARGLEDNVSVIGSIACLLSYDILKGIFSINVKGIILDWAKNFIDKIDKNGKV